MALSLTIPGGAVQLSANPIWIKVAGAVIPSGATEYKLLCKITSVDGDLLGGPFVDGITPNADGESLFDISGLVDQPMLPEFQWPAVAVTVAHAKLAWKIKVEFGETYIDSSGDRQITYAGTFENITILKGGISDFAMGEYNDGATTFYEDWIEGGKFLTNQPLVSVVAPDQIVKLWYMGQWATNHDITLFTQIFLNTKVAVIPLMQAVTIYETTGLLELNINPIFQGFELDPGEEITSFEFWIEDSGGEVSETRTFIVDNSFKENSNYLLAVNSKSGIDVIWLNGNVEKNVDTSGTEGYKPLGINDGSRVATILATGRSSRKKWKINTGFKSSEEIEALHDIYLARHMWLYTESKLIPVIMSNGDKLLNNTSENLHALDLEFMQAHNTRYI
ncbi:MAG: hypothetical protein JZU49_01015 [Sulfuricurvum sp.]|nr:hypothetical protein [Sulfuricurvum sp.]